MECQEQKRVFSSVPDIRAWYPSESVRAAGDAVYHCLEHGEGLALVYGETGMGKTLLLQDMAELFDQEDAVVFPLSRIDTAKSLLQQILHGLHQTWCGCSENEMRLILRDYFQQTQYRRVIILLDDAQSFRLSVFEEIRSLLDHWSNREGLVRIALAGTHRLEERLTHPKLTPFQQRIVTQVWLEPFTLEETSDYLDRETRRIEEESVRASFSKEAKEMIQRISEGVPRRINQIARQVIFHSVPVEATVRTINATEVEKAWSELQQIPFAVINNESSNSKSNNSRELFSGDSSDNSALESVATPDVNSLGSAGNNNNSIVEFGTLSDDEDDDEEMKPQNNTNSLNNDISLNDNDLFQKVTNKSAVVFESTDPNIIESVTTEISGTEFFETDNVETDNVETDNVETDSFEAEHADVIQSVTDSTNNIKVEEVDCNNNCKTECNTKEETDSEQANNESQIKEPQTNTSIDINSLTDVSSNSSVNNNDFRIYRFDLHPSMAGATFVENQLESDNSEKKETTDQTKSKPEEIGEILESKVIKNGKDEGGEYKDSDYKGSELSLSELLQHGDELHENNIEERYENLENGEVGQEETGSLTFSLPRGKTREEYLEDLVHLEEEVSMEASIIRQIRKIHSQMGNAHSTVYEKAQNREEEKKPKSDQTRGKANVRSVFRQIYLDE